MHKTSSIKSSRIHKNSNEYAEDVGENVSEVKVKTVGKNVGKNVSSILSGLDPARKKARPQKNPPIAGGCLTSNMFSHESQFSLKNLSDNAPRCILTRLNDNDYDKVNKANVNKENAKPIPSDIVESVFGNSTPKKSYSGLKLRHQRHLSKKFSSPTSVSKKKNSNSSSMFQNVSETLIIFLLWSAPLRCF